ncbi:MAG: tripartite tricarboxylate transporter permease, partial [bacterium]
KLRFRWPRAPLVLGLVLGTIAERYLWISVARYGTEWLGRPIVLVQIALTIAIIVSTLLQQRRANMRPEPGAIGAG